MSLSKWIAPTLLNRLPGPFFPLSAAQIISFLNALSKNLGIMATTKSPILVNLLQALATIIRINFKRLSVCLADTNTIEGIGWIDLTFHFSCDAGNSIKF